VIARAYREIVSLADGSGHWWRNWGIYWKATIR